MGTLRVGLIGAGSMGSLHARTIATNSGSTLVWVADPDDEARTVINKRWNAKGIRTPDLSNVDAVVVAAPTDFHFDLGCEILAAGKPLLMEKPLAEDLSRTSELVDAARAADVPLMCGLLERFNPALRTALEIVEQPLSLRTARHSPYAPRIKTGVAWDLLIHDVDFCLRLFADEPHIVTGLDSVLSPFSEPEAQDLIECVAKFAGDRIASMSASRLAHTKTRSVTITELSRVIEIDLLRQDITIFRHVNNRGAEDGTAGYLQQTIIEIPVVRNIGEPLVHQWNHFLDIANGVADHDIERDSILPAHRVVARCLEACHGG
jgi:predicted dehydrogenase